MYVGNLIAGVTAAVYKLYVYIRVINQQTNQFARRITAESYSVLSPEYQYGQEEREQKQKEIDARTQEVLDGAPKDGAE